MGKNAQDQLVTGGKVSDSEEKRMVEEAIAGGVELVNSLAEHFAGVIGRASSVAELREYSHKMNKLITDITSHVINNQGCHMTGTHLMTIAAISEFYCALVMANVCCGETFAVFRERAVRMVQAAAARRVASLRDERTYSAVVALIHGLREVESQLATQEVAHGATRH